MSEKLPENKGRIPIISFLADAVRHGYKDALQIRNERLASVTNMPDEDVPAENDTEETSDAPDAVDNGDVIQDPNLLPTNTILQIIEQIALNDVKSVDLRFTREKEIPLDLSYNTEDVKKMIGFYFDNNETQVSVGQCTDFTKCHNFGDLFSELTILSEDQRSEYIYVSFRHEDEQILGCPKHKLASNLNGHLLTPNQTTEDGVIIKVRLADIIDKQWDYKHILDPYFEDGVNIGIQDVKPMEDEEIDDFTVCPRLGNLQSQCAKLFAEGAQYAEMQIHCYSDGLNANSIFNFAQRVGFEAAASQHSIVYLKITKEQFENGELLKELTLELVPYFNKGIVAMRGQV